MTHNSCAQDSAILFLNKYTKVKYVFLTILIGELRVREGGTYTFMHTFFNIVLVWHVPHAVNICNYILLYTVDIIIHIYYNIHVICINFPNSFESSLRQCVVFNLIPKFFAECLLYKYLLDCDHSEFTFDCVLTRHCWSAREGTRLAQNSLFITHGLFFQIQPP